MEATEAYLDRIDQVDGKLGKLHYRHAGRDPSQIPATLLITWDPSNASNDNASREGIVLAGSFENIIQRVKEYESAGVEAMAINIASDDPFIIQRHMKRFAAEVLPDFQ